RDGRVIILPPMTADEHIAAQRESKARTTLLQSILDDHVGDFHYMDDAKDIYNAVKARGIAQRYKLKTLEVDVKGYTTFSSSQSAGPSHSAFVSTTSASKKMSYEDSPGYSLTTTDIAPSNPMTGYHRSEFGMIDGCDTTDAIKEGAAKIYNLITGADTEAASTAGVLENLLSWVSLLRKILFQTLKMKGSLIVVVLEICDKKNRVLFTDTECLMLSKDFKLPDDSMVVLKVPRKQNLYTINLNNLCHRGNLPCLVANASVDESIKWHRRMGHVNYKSMNRLVKGNLVRGLPPKLFKNNHTCVACCKGKQYKASYKAINVVSSISEPLQLLHMDLFGPTSIRSIDHKYYFLVITDDYIRFCWVFFLEHKDETYPILKDFINLVENQLTKRVLVTSPHNKTPYALLTGNIPSVSHFKPFGCHVAILNTSDHLGKFDGKVDEGYIVGYSASNKAYRVYNVPNKRVEETINLRFLKEKPNVQGLGHKWYFDLDYLTDTLGYQHVQANQFAETQEATTTPVGTEPTDTSCDEVDDSPLNSANENFQMELAGLNGQEQRATFDAESLGLGFKNNAEELQTRASAKTVPTGSIPVPADLGNHDPSPGIFSSSSYDDEFGAALNNVAFTVEFLGRRLISWQCKKQTIVATSSTEAEYGAAANCCGQVLWIQN
nr:ribonuclease H-like domain-containing protein [Tanacetum cinerariifolium]